MSYINEIKNVLFLFRLLQCIIIFIHYFVQQLLCVPIYNSSEIGESRDCDMLTRRHHHLHYLKSSVKYYIMIYDRHHSSTA